VRSPSKEEPTVRTALTVATLYRLGNLIPGERAGRDDQIPKDARFEGGVWPGLFLQFRQELNENWGRKGC
jgi:hypothetical protein